MLGGLAGLAGLSAVAGVLVTLTVTPAIALSGAAATSAITMFDNLPSVLEIDKLMLPTTLYYKHPETGEDLELAKFYDQNRSPVTYEEVAPVMYDAILSSEDPRYYQHGGVDLIGTTRAILSNFKGGGETQGGSSISQQYVKNILIQRCERDAKDEPVLDDNGEPVMNEDGTPQMIPREQVLLNCWTDATTASGIEGYQRKLQEMRYAISLEQRYSKTDILLGYLNIANFGGTTYGVDAAAKYYFGVAAKDLTLGQAATLAGIVQNPNAYRIDRPEGTMFDDEGNAYNKAPDGVVDDIAKKQVGALNSKLEKGEITEEQYIAAADGYSATKGRQLYVLSRMLDDGKITEEQYDEAVLEPITPNIHRPTTGCVAAGGAAYFCQLVKNIIETDPAFGETREDRLNALKRGGLKVYTTLDVRVQGPAEQAMTEWAPTSVEGMVDANTGKFGAAGISIEASTGRILSVVQNTKFSEDGTLADDPNYSSLVFAADQKYGRSGGFEVGSTFKLFTLIDWLEKGHSVNEVVNGNVRPIKRLTNSCNSQLNGPGDWVNTGNVIVKNFNNQRGYVGTPMKFTRDSLNTGFFAMAEKLDLCDIKNVATKMGVTLGNGEPVRMDDLFSIIGSNNVSPMAMAGAYGTVANNGVYCQPRAIDRVVDADGNEITPPQTTCTQVLDPKVAATAAYALEGVMKGGTGNRANPYDGTPVLGKTGTHESWQTWLVQSSSKVATATWVGNSTGKGDIFQRWHNGQKMSDLRYIISRAIQGAANSVYGGDPFPQPDRDLTKQVLTDLPNVVGMPVDQARQTLENAGFEVVVGDPVDSSEAEGIVAAQNPGAGKVAGGTVVTINPSNGQGLAVPDVSGRPLDEAVRAIQRSGFGNVQPGTCTVDDRVNNPRATGTSPGAGSVVNRNTQITVNYAASDCGGGGGPGGPGGGPGGPGGPGGGDSGGDN